ncbi:hypothetical protein F0L74_31465 [Chitinophaga agrisoli]|uniref:Uncharacterized protein n=1 Tax=Chitinophaga agrisoli TaxID=2607653 RepID=A0A5B2VQL7_9BACT|nr:hypothetical protein [Chitinophaga agrisoli]KAA2240666.1 hypothetical protein F0L74_31465 [Chitinophaga agrisoli]
MKRQWLHKILSIILLGVFALQITPREFIHLLAPHQDTVDKEDHGSHTSPVFSVKHKHCDFLQIGVPPYEQITSEYIAPTQPVIWVYTLPYIPVAAISCVTNAALRAPPAIS